MRVSDGFVLGRTPETIELRRSPEPVRVRIEAMGFVPAVHDVPATSDGQMSIALVPAAKPRSQRSTQ